MVRPLLHTIWLNGRLGGVERFPQSVMARLRGVAAGHTHFVHTDDECARAVGREGDVVAASYGALRRPAKRANLCRLALLRQLGGVYLDVDTVPLVPLRTVFTRRNVLTTVLSFYKAAHLNLGVMAAPRDNPFLRNLMQAVVAEAGTRQTDGDFLNASYDFHRRMRADVGKSLAPGLNRNARRPGYDYYLLREECSANGTACGGRLDQKVGLCCVIYDGARPVFLQRDPDFPFSWPWGGSS